MVAEKFNVSNQRIEITVAHDMKELILASEPKESDQTQFQNFTHLLVFTPFHLHQAQQPGRPQNQLQDQQVRKNSRKLKINRILRNQ